MGCKDKENSGGENSFLSATVIFAAGEKKKKLSLNTY